MKFTAFKLILLTLLAMFAATASLAQGDVDQKRTAGKKAFDDGIAFRKRNTFPDYRKALEQFELSARLYDEIGDRPNVASAWLGIGLIENLLGNGDEAIEYYQRALAVFREFELDGLAARALNNLAIIHWDRGDLQKSLALHRQALPLRRAARDKTGEADTYNGIGAVYSSMGERQKALDNLKRAALIQETNGLEPDLATTNNNIGHLYNQLGDNEKAQEYLERSLTLHRKTGNRPGEAIALNNLGLTFSDTDAKKAIENYLASLAIFEEIGFTQQLGTLYTNIGTAYLDLGDPEKTVEFNRRALPIQKQSGDTSGQATALNNIGLGELRLGRANESLNTFTESLVLARASQEKGLEAIVLCNLMQAHKPRDPGVGAFYGKQCINTYQELRAAISGLDISTQQIYLKTIEDNYRFLADLLIEAGRLTEAKEVLAMLKDEEFSRFVRRDADETKSLSRRAVLTDREKVLVERYSILAEKTVKAAKEFEEIDRRKRAAEKNGGKLSDSDESEHRRLLSEFSKVNTAFREFLEKELVGSIGRDTAQKIDNDRALQEKLRRFGNGTVAVTTVVTDKRYRVILTTPSGQFAAKTEITASVLNKKIFAFREMLKSPGTETRTLGKELYDIIVKPIEPALKASGATTIVWSLDGTLRYIPIAALSPDGQSYLIEKYQSVVLTPQTRDDIGDSQAVWKALGMGVSTAQSVIYPDYPDEPVKLEALPAVEEELKTVVRQPEISSETGILAGRRFLNDDFTLRNLTVSLAKRNSAGGKEFSVVHLASHFRLAPNWSDSFLLIGGGKILTLEAMTNSADIDFTDVELVTLSACNTATGDLSNGGEVDGLAGVIQSKNGKSVLATLWEVQDDSTAALMSSFYRLRQANPTKTKIDALVSAQKLMLYGSATPKSAIPNIGPKFRKDPSRPFAHPAYWSGFVLIGNWR